MLRKNMSRRSFIKGATATGAAVAGLSGSKLVFDMYQNVKEASAEGKVEYKPGYCGICSMNCAFSATVKDGKVVKLEGNPEDLQGGGSLCAKGNSFIRTLYDPDRLKYPMVRTNPEKGIGIDPQWKKISWEEAFELAGQKLTEAKNKGGGKSIIWIGKHKGKDFLKAVGSPNDLCHHSTCDTVRHVACHEFFGSSAYIPDFEETKYVLSFGWDQFSKAKNAWTRLLAQAITENQAKLVVFDPRLTATASKANEWHPIRPGSDHAVVLAMLNVIISEGLYDQEFVEKYTSGFEQLATEVKKYSPVWASKLSGIPAEDIIRIAREFATAESAVIPLHKREAAQVRLNGMSLAQGMLCMMAITGNFERRGGALLRRKIKLGKTSAPEKPAPLETEVRIDGAEQFPALLPKPLSGEGIFQTVPDAILSDKPYKVHAAIIYAQGLYAMSDTKKYIEALKKLDFVININILPDEITYFADLLLPETTYMEGAGVSERSYHAIYEQLAVKEELVKPIGETLSLGKIVEGIADKMGLKQYLAPGGKTKREAQLAEQGLTFDQVVKIGGVYTPNPTFKAKDLTKLKTPSGKLELYSTSLAEHGYDPIPTHKDKWMIAPKEDNEFYFTTTRFATVRHASSQNNLWVSEIHPENWVSINKKQAAKLGIKDGDKVKLTSPYGVIELKAKLTEGIRPDTICVPHGYGHWSKDLNVTKGKGANDGDIMPAFDIEKTKAPNDPSGSSFDCQMIVKVTKL